ncbi:methylglyoxal synthase [Salsuginibacillus halophilus]|uniref:Methylglyoxal synthase n=1 Tax=Salsuginibacillus halophilus TaxID=517424 RepID=A0A2P8HWC6_9BACI|nr:methylglyoxal synthase [Salsuginibacillus halophilus]PSL50526.1 methylglyoxal synthase [Salsuginibacillus halophilus]
MEIALIAHDEKKDDLVAFVKKHQPAFTGHTLVATGTTGMRLQEETGLEITRKQSGPLGGDQEIGALVTQGEIELVLFFRDPLTAQPHEPDITALLRVCDVHGVAAATNEKTAEALVEKWLTKGMR